MAALVALLALLAAASPAAADASAPLTAEIRAGERVLAAVTGLRLDPHRGLELGVAVDERLAPGGPWAVVAQPLSPPGAAVALLRAAAAGPSRLLTRTLAGWGRVPLRDPGPGEVRVAVTLVQ